MHMAETEPRSAQRMASFVTGSMPAFGFADAISADVDICVHSAAEIDPVARACEERRRFIEVLVLAESEHVVRACEAAPRELGTPFVEFGIARLLQVLGHRCSAFNADRPWLIAESMILFASCWVELSHRRASLGSPAKPWVSTRPRMRASLPATSAIAATSVHAVYSHRTAQLDGLSTLDLPVLSIGVDTDVRVAPASREQFVEIFECMPRILHANTSLLSSIDTAAQSMSRRMFSGFRLEEKQQITPAINTSNEKDCIHQEFQSCCNRANIIDLILARLNNYNPTHINQSAPMKQKPDSLGAGARKGGLERPQHQHPPNGARDRLSDVAGLKPVVAPEIMATPAPERFEDDEAESPFSAENLHLAFLGRRKYPFEPS